MFQFFLESRHSRKHVLKPNLIFVFHKDPHHVEVDTHVGRLARKQNLSKNMSYFLNAGDDSLNDHSYVIFGESLIEVFQNGRRVDLDDGLEDKGGELAGEAVIFEKFVVDEEEGDLLAALLLDLVTEVADPPEEDVSFRLEDVVCPLHELPPN